MTKPWSVGLLLVAVLGVGIGLVGIVAAISVHDAGPHPDDNVPITLATIRAQSKTALERHYLSRPGVPPGAAVDYTDARLWVYDGIWNLRGRADWRDPEYPDLPLADHGCRVWEVNFRVTDGTLVCTEVIVDDKTIWQAE